MKRSQASLLLTALVLLWVRLPLSGQTLAADRRFRLQGMAVGGQWWQGAAGSPN